MIVTVYDAGPACMKCRLTKRALDKAGIPYDVIPLEAVPELVEAFKAEGLSTAPIVEVRKDGLVERWDDFRPSKIGTLA